jgi:hypothetical protein
MAKRLKLFIMKLLSINEYANKVKCTLSNPTLEEIQNFVEENYEESIWDYSLEELEYVLNEVNENICFVKVGNEIRICELY